MSEAPSSKPTLDPDWMRTPYAETWKQYCHEDTLGQSRTTTFMAIHTAFIGILAFAAKPLLEIDPRAAAGEYHVWGFIVFGGLAAGLGITSLLVDHYWAKVTSAGHDYVKVRRATLIAIEAACHLDRIGPASIEGEWQRQPRDKHFTPYAEQPSLIVGGYPSTEGWSSSKRVVTVMKAVHWSQLLVGGLLLAIGLCRLCRAGAG